MVRLLAAWATPKPDSTISNARTMPGGSLRPDPEYEVRGTRYEVGTSTERAGRSYSTSYDAAVRGTVPWRRGRGCTDGYSATGYGYAGNQGPGLVRNGMLASDGEHMRPPMEVPMINILTRQLPITSKVTPLF